VDKNGKTVWVQVDDGCGSVLEYTVPRYVNRGIQPPWRTLPIQNNISGK